MRHRHVRFVMSFLLLFSLLFSYIGVPAWALFSTDDTPEDIADDMGWDYSLYEAEEYTYTYSASDMRAKYGAETAQELFPNGGDETFERRSIYGWDYYNDIVKTTKDYLGIVEGGYGGGKGIAELALQEWQLCEEEVSNSVYGQRRETNGDNNVMYTRYWNMPGSAWCAMFVFWCADQLGYMDGVIFPKELKAACDVEAYWWENNGNAIYRASDLKCFGGGTYQPQAGDIVIYSDNKYVHAHTGIVVDSNDTSFTTVEGNWGNRVSKRVFTKSAFYACYRDVKMVHIDYPIENDNEQDVYDSLRSRYGLNAAAACGVMANIKQDSDFDPKKTTSDGRRGLCLWNNAEWSVLTSYCESRSLDPDTIYGQLDYLVYDVLQNKQEVYVELRKSTNTQEGAETAARYWCRNYAGLGASEADTRAGIADSMWATHSSG